MDLVVRNATLAGRPGSHDIAIEGGRIAAVGPELAVQGVPELDAEHGLVTPTFVNPHVHLDKALLGETMRPNVSQTLQEAIEITWDFKRTYTVEDILTRASACVDAAVAQGTTVLRVFADVGTIGGLTPVEALIALRERWRGIADIQVVAFPQEGIDRDPGTESLLDKAMQMGADVAGGLPWYERTDAHMRRHVDVVLELARRYDADVHMLVDDTDDATSRSLEYLAVRTIEAGWQGRVAASHCGALARYNDVHAAKVVALVKESGVAIVSNPHISLVLAGRADREPIPRGITRVRELLAAGVNVASGQDDIKDPYYPFGRGSQLEVALFMAHTAHLTHPPELEQVLAMVTANAARALRLPDYGIAPGSHADLNVWRAPNVQDLLRLQEPPRHVLKRGRLLASWSVTCDRRWATPPARSS
ncbi:MAG: amidohydrolase family protein [Candidatus Binatia bacterium]